MSTFVAEPLPQVPPSTGGTPVRALGRPAGVQRLLGRHPLTGRELGLVGLGMTLLALATFIGHIRHGGFYYDDWGVLSIVRFPSHATHSAISALWPYYDKRPGEVVWYALVDSTLGFHASLQLILAGAMLTFEVLCIFAVMRMLGLATLHSALMCALTLVFPFSDSQWLWAIMSMATLATALGLVGVMLAVRGLEREGRSAWLAHSASVAMLAASILSYEVFAVLGCLSGLVYAHRVGLRRARARWAVDVVVILGTLGFAKILLPRDLATPASTQSLSGLVHHATLIVRQGARIFGSAALPVGSLDYRIVLAALLVLFGTAAATFWLAPASDPARAVLGRWLLIGGIGVLVAGAAWAIYLPAIDYYSPSAQGTGNRVNGLAGVGIIIYLYASAVLLATLLWRVRTRARPDRGPIAMGAVPAVLAVVGTLVLGAGYLHRTSSDTRVWNRAIAEQSQMLSTIRQLLPPLRAQRITLYTFHHPTAVSSWVAVFRYPWDLSGALKHAYGFRGIAGVPVSRGTRFACGATGFYPTNNGYHRGNGAAYGQAYFIDVGGRRAVAVTDRAACERLTDALRSGTDI